MSRRLMLRKASGGGGLPSEYQQVRWIGASGGSNFPYINTNIMEAPGVTIHAFIELFDFNDAKIFGTYNGGVAVYQSKLRCLERQTLTLSNLIFATGINSVTYHANTIKPISVTYYLGEENETVTSRYATVNSAYYLFACNLSNKAYSGFNGRFHNYVEFLDSNNDLLAFFVPCYRKADGTIGMFDIVSNTFFTNAGTGAFTKGADV